MKNITCRKIQPLKRLFHHQKTTIVFKKPISRYYAIIRSSRDMSPLHLATKCVANDTLGNQCPDLSPPIHLSTTYVSENEEKVIYSRNDTVTRRSCENILSNIFGGSTITYSSGQSALFSLLSVLKPKRVILDSRHGYFGSHSLFESMKLKTVLGLFDTPFEEEDVIFVECPRNPTMDVVNLEALTKLVKESKLQKCSVVVDSTFAPPGTFDPFKFGVDYIYHSCTKYLGGHSDILMGAIICRPDHSSTFTALHSFRSLIGNVPGGLESWLLMRSLKTLYLRVAKQSENSVALVQWLQRNKEELDILKIYHTTVSDETGVAYKLFGDIHPPMMAIEMKTENQARMLSKYCTLFKDATSLGGVESIMEWRYKFDGKLPPNLVRFSIGIEHIDDIIQDLKQAFQIVKSLKI